jgi:hypothetical protein
MKTKRKIFAGVTTIVMLTTGTSSNAQASGTTNLTVTVSAEASITVNTANTALTSSSAFGAYTGSTAFTYLIRTTPSTGAGNIQMQITSDFSPAGGPSVASPPTAGDALTYACTVAAPATACSGNITSRTTTQTSVASFGADAHSALAGNSGSVAWSLSNDPTYKAAAYTAVATFTISAT